MSSKNQDEQYIEPNPTEEEIQEQIEVIEMVNDAMNIAEDIATHTMKKKEYNEGDIRNQYVDYAYTIGGEDLVYLIECENATWNLSRQSDVYRNGKREESYGLCQVHRPQHKWIVGNPIEKDEQRIKFTTDWKYQIEQCNKLMEEGTPFFGRERKIKGKKCSEYVKDRFILEQNENG